MWVNETGDIRAVLRRNVGVRLKSRLVGDECLATHYANTHAAELGDVVTETVAGPLASTVLNRRVDVPELIARKKRNLETNASALVTRVAIFARLRSVHPLRVFEKIRYARAIDLPDGDVDVCMLSRDATRVEIDGPAAKQPIRDIMIP
jgi:hypothetical protein